VLRLFFRRLGPGSIATLHRVAAVLSGPRRGGRALGAQPNTTEAHAAVTGESLLDGSQVLGRSYKSIMAGSGSICSPDEETNERGWPWPNIAVAVERSRCSALRALPRPASGCAAHQVAPRELGEGRRPFRGRARLPCYERIRWRRRRRPRRSCPSRRRWGPAPRERRERMFLWPSTSVGGREISDVDLHWPQPGLHLLDEGMRLFSSRSAFSPTPVPDDGRDGGDDHPRDRRERVPSTSRAWFLLGIDERYTGGRARLIVQPPKSATDKRHSRSR
jgi:hypothetical protein